MMLTTPSIQSWVLDEEPSLAIMKAAWDLGINTIDTANLYSNGESERLIAKFIQKVTLPRLSQLVYHSHPPSIKFLVIKS